MTVAIDAVGEVELEGRVLAVRRIHVTYHLDGPLKSLRWLAGQLPERGEAWHPGQPVIPGSPTRLVRVGPNALVRASITAFGAVAVCFAAQV